jgi:drug/metabolite transporter (DMT)-like permease
MVLTGPVAAVVVCAALMHAGWNVAIRADGDRRAATAWMAVAAAGLSALALPFLEQPAMASWINIAISGVLHTAYYLLVAEAYTHGGVALAYPLMRGTAPLLTTIAAWALLGEHLPLGGWIGILGISSGVVLLARRRGDRAERAAVTFALANAAVIASYTINDAIGARASGAPVAYTLWMELISVPFAAGFLWRWRLPRWPGRKAMARATGGALFSISAYALVLWAMTRAPVAPVAALRETSLLFAVLLARTVLGERPGRRGWAAAAVIAIGAVVLRLA